jgi:hypothetical protein
MGDKKILEKRLYFFVPYNISEIQKGIQAGHAALRYARKFGEKDPEVWDFIDNHETWIILNGGTTNSKLKPGIVSPRDINDPYQGTLDNLYVKFIDWNMKNPNNHIKSAIFQEPDLNDALTAICFLVDERSFDFINYPDLDKFAKGIIEKEEWFEFFKNGPWDYDFIKNEIPHVYSEWEKSLGGSDKAFIRTIIKGKKLA